MFLNHLQSLLKLPLRGLKDTIFYRESYLFWHNSVDNQCFINLRLLLLNHRNCLDFLPKHIVSCWWCSVSFETSMFAHLLSFSLDESSLDTIPTHNENKPQKTVNQIKYLTQQEIRWNNHLVFRFILHLKTDLFSVCDSS